MQLLTSVLFVVALFSVHLAKCDKNVMFKYFTMCKNASDYPSKIYVSFKNKNGIQLISGNMTFSEDFGEKTLAPIQLSLTPPGGKNMLHLGGVNDTFCKMLKRYAGPFINDVQKAAQMIPGTCPISKGTYHVQDFVLPINRMFLKGFAPYGTLNILGQMSNLETGRPLLCYEAEILVS